MSEIFRSTKSYAGGSDKKAQKHEPSRKALAAFFGVRVLRLNDLQIYSIRSVKYINPKRNN